MVSSIVGDADGNKITDLAAGRYYTFNLDVPQTNESSPRIQWVKGITPPNDNEWLKNESETAWYLPYNEKYGWTDVNKVDGSNTNPYDLADGNGVADLHRGLVRRADVLYHRYDDLFWRSDRPHRGLRRGLRIVRVNTAIVLIGHEHHLS